MDDRNQQSKKQKVIDFDVTGMTYEEYCAEHYGRAIDTYRKRRMEEEMAMMQAMQQQQQMGGMMGGMGQRGAHVGNTGAPGYYAPMMGGVPMNGGVMPRGAGGRGFPRADRPRYNTQQYPR